MKKQTNQTKPAVAHKSLAETKVEEVLSEKPSTLHPSDSVEKAGALMREMEAGEWPVAEEKKLLGTVDKANPDREAARYGHDPKKTRVASTMSRNVAYCYEDQTCEEVLRIMDERQLQYLPVVNRNERITGIVSRKELLLQGSEEQRAS